MDQELTKSINDADDIKTSGRWAEINIRIQYMAENTGSDNAWWVQLFGALCFQNFSEYHYLICAYEKKQERDVSLLAWRARNLLELFVWARYCAKSRENSRRFYEDAGRDAIDIYQKFIEWGTVTSQQPDWLNPLKNAKKDVSERAASKGIKSLGGPYKKVSDAAQECGIKDHFNIDYKLLSKFAHPTAMQVLGSADRNSETVQRDRFFSLGCLYFTGAFNALEAPLLA